MTLIRLVCLVLIISGGVIMTVTTWQYHKMLRYSRKERYGSSGYGRVFEFFSQITFLFFIIGFIIGALDVLRRDVEPIYLFVGVVFFIGALFVCVMIKVMKSLEDSLRDKTMEVMLAFVNSIEMKDAYTQGHSWHVYHIVRLFYSCLPPKRKGEINEPKLLDAALLHDIGKMGVNNEILNKRSPLCDEDWKEIMSHPSHGKKMLENTCFAEIGDWVCYHHERIDGAGYYGLKGDDIPIESRIIAVADTYSAITTNREYRPRRSHETAIEIIRDVAGTQLDSELVEYFCAIDKDSLCELNLRAWER